MTRRWLYAPQVDPSFPFQDAFLSNDRGSYKKVLTNTTAGKNTQPKFGALVKAGSSKTVPIFNTASVLQGLPETESTRPWLDEIGWVGQEQ